MSNRSENRDCNLWEEIYQRFETPLRYRALRLANGRAFDADDLLQETMYRALRYSTNPENIRNPLGYLLRIMANVLNTWQRKNSAAILLSLDELLSQDAEERRTKIVEPSIDPVAERILEHEELWEQFSLIRGPLKEREDLLIELHLKGYTCDEIAEQLGEDVRLISSDLNAVRTKVRARIQKALEKQGERQN